jgi:hypothetical protein
MLKETIYKIAKKYIEYCEENVLSKKNVLYETAEKLEIPLKKLQVCEEKRLFIYLTKYKNNAFMLKAKGNTKENKDTITLKYVKKEEQDIYQKFKMFWNLYIKFLREYDETLKELNLLEEKLIEESIYEKAQQKIFSGVA